MSDTYKGVRDFYPEEQRIQDYIFCRMRRAVERFGYEEMNASILEPTDLYRTKTSEEIVREQTYTFTDRGERSVTLRPEMTPTVARMVGARRRDLGFPLRWYSIQNFFRYEKPQKGRLREFWQLNADLFGIPGLEADLEIIALASAVMKELGATDDMFEVRIASRKLLTRLYGPLLKEGVAPLEMFRLLDKKEKLPRAAFDDAWEHIATEPFTETSEDESEELAEVRRRLAARGVTNIRFSPYTVRGFDYYTDIVFEVFDTSGENARSLFGGGRYDSLVEAYGGEAVPAVGFGMGDVTARDFLDTHGLLPSVAPATQLYLAPASTADGVRAAAAADALRAAGINVALGMKHEKIADHIKAAAKLGVPYFAAYGENEEGNKSITIKNLASGEERVVPFTDAASFFAA